MSTDVLAPNKHKSHFISSRKDIATSNHVDMAVSIQRDFGTPCAIEYLQAKGVQNDITKRVLSKPDHRRGQR